MLDWIWRLSPGVAQMMCGGPGCHRGQKGVVSPCYAKDSNTNSLEEVWAVAHGKISTENTKDTLCRNVTIYGHCRYEDKGISVQLIGGGQRR
jgi:hypothetical protein